MNKQEAIDILIGMSVCIESKLHCDEDCPFYKENEDCIYVAEGRNFELKEAVEVLKK